MKKHYLLYLLLLSIPAAAQQNFDTVKIRPLKLTDNIYMLKGAGGNIGVLVGKDGTLVIDDQFAPLSNKINGAIKTIDPAEIKFLVNTHIHGDHSGGNDNFARMGVMIVAHDNVRERMMKESTARNGQKNPPRAKEALPVISFPDRINFHLNDEDIEVIALDKGHTDGDVMVHFKKANIYHTGDAFVRYGYPFIDASNGGSFTAFVNSLDRMLAVLDDNSRVIPGHGEVATKADVKAFRDKMADIRDQVTAALKKGTKVEEITSLPIATKYDADFGTTGFVKGKDFVLMAAENIKATMPAATNSKGKSAK
ncbi:MAG TPA: MBL fold metallo-hydrolase [Cyclobacteriaceae bacterium]|nr:MBL fold metallo-hydrolase [Cyclobacteriaceae bacterium]